MRTHGSRNILELVIHAENMLTYVLPQDLDLVPYASIQKSTEKHRLPKFETKAKTTDSHR